MLRRKKHFRYIKQLGISSECYFYGYFKSPGLRHYRNNDWVNDDYLKIKNKFILKKDILRIANNYFSIGQNYNLFSKIDYVIMMPLKSSSVSNLENIIDQLLVDIKKNKINDKVKFLKDVFSVQDYKKFWENKMKLEERKKEINDKITLNKKYINFFNNKNILIIDDVVSTGVSIAEVSLILGKNNFNIKTSALCYGTVYKWKKIYS